MKRKIGASRVAIVRAKGAEAAWKLALARTLRASIGLDLTVTDLHQDRRSVAELLEMPPDQALIAMLAGPAEGLGMIALSPDIMAGLIEMQTMRRVIPNAAPPRKPTRTDAAMTCGLIDAALTDLDAGLEQDEDLVWAGGFRYASFLEDPRPLGLLLEDQPYRVLRADLSLEGGAKTGSILLALPADGRGPRPKPVNPVEGAGAGLMFTAALSEQIRSAEAVLTAVLARVSLPLQMVLSLKPGDPVVLGTAVLDQIDLEGINGVRLAGGKLGQNRGMRAVRMMETAAPAARVVVKPAAAASGDVHQPQSLRPTGS